MPDTRYEIVYPLRRAANGSSTPFPTIYWLTDPALDRAIANLERQGAIGETERIIQNDPVLLASFRADHERYRDARWAMLTDADRAEVEASPSMLASFRAGIAGTAKFSTVKCLHAHVAHYLADAAGNTIAQLLIERFNLKL